jgi:DNA-binding transcriptional LysR family regulator
MDTYRLRYFCTIVDTGSLTKAAALLGLSHSALSKSLSLLQLELGFQLMRPLGRGLELTPEGKVFYQRAQNVLRELQALATPQSEILRKFVRVGVSEAFACSLIEKFAHEVGEGVEFHELDAGEMEVKIIQDEIDFALSFTPFPHPDLEYLKLRKVPMGVFYTHPSHQKMSWEELPFVVPLGALKDNPLSIRTQDGWPSDRPRKIIYRVSTLTMAARIVEDGLAAVYAPRFAMEQLLRKNLREREGKFASRDVFLVKKKNIEESAVMKRLGRLIRTQLS